MSDFLVLNQDEQDDIIVGFMLAQERDLHCHKLNLYRYNAMLLTIAPGKWHDRVTQLRDDTVQRLAEVNDIINASKIQMPDTLRLKAAKARLLVKES